MKVFYFTASWCSACKRMRPVIEKLIDEGFKIQIVDADKNKLASEYNITALPTIVVVQDSKEVKRFVGLTSIDDLRSQLKKDSDYRIW